MVRLDPLTTSFGVSDAVAASVEPDAPNRTHPAVAAASRVVVAALAARTIVVAAPLGLWAAVSLGTHSVWTPGASPYLWIAAAVAFVCCFVAFEELGAVARHRRSDAAVAANTVELGAAVRAPHGGDLQMQLGGRRVVALVVDASEVWVDRRAVLCRSGLRRGVSVGRLRSAARRAGADPAVIVAGCRLRDCAGHTGSPEVEVVCPAALTTDPGTRATAPRNT